MSLPFDRQAYMDCFSLFDRALASKKGVQRLFQAKDEAYAFRSRLNRARTLDAKINRKMYADQPDHPSYGTSEYYQVTVKVVEDRERGLWLCRLEKNEIPLMEIEEIEPQSEDEEINLENAIAELENAIAEKVEVDVDLD